MREITTHKVNGLNEAIMIFAVGERGPGGANNHYSLTMDHGNKTCHGSEIHFQEGPIAEAGVNGVSNEALLAIVLDRLLSFQAGSFANDDTELAALHVEVALGRLRARTNERMQRGVEGTMQK